MSNQITNPIQYSSITPTASAPAAVITLPSNQPINFSGQTDANNLESNFTIGLWVRATANCKNALHNYTNHYPIFTNGQVYIAYNNEGEIEAGFGTMDKVGVSIASCYDLMDGEWHFVAVSYLQQNSKNLSMLYLYIDGALVNDCVVITSRIGDATATQPQLCQPVQLLADQSVDVSAFMLWNIGHEGDAIDKNFGSPLVQGDDAIGLISAFDFANGTIVDTTNNGTTIAVGSHRWNTPCLQISGAGQLTIPVESGIKPCCEAGDFSVMGWFSFPVEQVGNFDLMTNVQSSGNTLQVGVACTKNTLNQLMYQIYFQAYNETTLLQTYDLTPTPWNHIAVTYNNQSQIMNFYHNGVLVATGGMGAYTNSWQTNEIPTQLSFGTTKVSANVQGLSYWNTALSVEDILKTVTTDADPTDAEGCIASLPFITASEFGMRISINNIGYQIGIEDGTTANVQEVISPVITNATKSSTNYFQKRINSNSSTILQHTDYLAHAKELGIDTTAQPSEEMKADPDFINNVEWYKTMLTNIKPELANRLLDRFQRNLSTGKLLAQKAPNLGRFSIKSENGVHTVYYGTRKGLEPIGPIHFENAEVDSTQQQAFLMVLNDALGIMMTLLGLRVSSATISKVSQKFITSSFMTACTEGIKILKNAPKEVWASITGKFLVNFVSSVSSITGSVGTFIKQILEQFSWWDFILACASVALTIVGWIATVGVGIVIKLGQLIVGLASFISNLISFIGTFMNNDEVQPKVAIA